MKHLLLKTFIIALFAHTFLHSQQHKLNLSIFDSDAIFAESNGLVAVEAEFFNKQTSTEIRQWYRVSKNESVSVKSDEDESHFTNASNSEYLEILPDTRVTHQDKLIKGENFSDIPGEIAVLNYIIKFNTPGRYYVWVRAYSTGSEDNGIHVGLNNTWPETGKRIQWCNGKNNWTWSNKQRTKEEHCGVPNQIYLDIDKAGIHEIQFSMREDGFEFDKFILTQDINYVPVGKHQDVLIIKNSQPESKIQGSNASYFKTIATILPENLSIASLEFPIKDTNFYINGKNWLAINPEEHKIAETTTTFEFKNGKYDIVFVGVGENDGSSIFTLLINGKEIGTYAPPLTENLFEEGKAFNALWENIKIKKGAKITVKAKVATDGNEWTRGRWAGIIFTPVGKGKLIQDSPSSFSQH